MFRAIQSCLVQDSRWPQHYLFNFPVNVLNYNLGLHLFVFSVKIILLAFDSEKVRINIRGACLKSP